MFKFVRKNGKWKYRLIHAFDGTDGQNPHGLTLGDNGTLYAVANGGANKAGTVFAISDP